MLEGKNLKLRALEPSDVDFLFEWENDEKLWHLSNTIAPFSRFVLEQYILNSHQDIFTNKQLRLMIDLKNGDNNYPIGSIDLFDFDPVPLHKPFPSYEMTMAVDTYRSSFAGTVSPQTVPN